MVCKILINVHPAPFQSFIFHDLHHEMVLCVAFSHDGEEVVAGGMSGHVKVSF